MMTHNISRQIAVVVVLVAASLALAAPGTAVAVGGETQPTELSGQPGQAQLGTNTTQQNTSNATASVELDSTNTTAKMVVVSKVRVPEGGFVAVHGVAYARRGVLRDSAITVSNYLSPGIHRNVSIPVKRGVPGIIANQTRLSYTRPNLSVVVHQNTNNNTQYDFVTSFGANDTPYQMPNDEPVVDTETVVLETNVQQVNQRIQTAPVRIRFENQQLRHVDGHPVLTIQNATLPKGGFVVIHDARYLGKTRDPINSAIGLSSYLKPGVHRNVTVRLLNGSINQTQTLVAVAYLDTDGDHSYDFVRTGGEDDYAYVAHQNDSTVIVNDTATVHVPRSQSQPATSPTPRATIPSTAATSTTTTTLAPTEQVTPQVEGKKGGEILSGSLRLLIGAVSVLILVVIVVVKLRGGRS